LRIPPNENETDLIVEHTRKVSLREVIEGVVSGNKILAIRGVRNLSGLGLRDSKELVEEAMANGLSKVKRQT
jgi:ribosomal protein L7/L12